MMPAKSILDSKPSIICVMAERVKEILGSGEACLISVLPKDTEENKEI
jgi:hypothetical protein